MSKTDPHKPEENLFLDLIFLQHNATKPTRENTFP
jgi:hypothetical protein